MALTANDAEGVPGGPAGGCLYQASSTLKVSNTTVAGNLAVGAAAVSSSPFLGGAGEGGGFYLNTGVSAALKRVRFVSNTAEGGQSSTTASSQGGFAAGGAIRESGPHWRSRKARSSATGRSAEFGLDATSAGTGGDVYGGAISVQTGSALILRNTTVSSNQATGGDGGTAHRAEPAARRRGAGYSSVSAALSRSSGSRIIVNRVLGGNAGTGGTSPPPATDHAGGNAAGGGVFLFIGSSGSFSRTSIATNVARGGSGGAGTYGGAGGSGSGAAIWSASESGNPATLTFATGTIAGNQAIGGQAGSGTTEGGTGGSATGGGMTLGSQITASFTRSQFNSNLASGAVAASGGVLATLGNTVTLSNDSFRANLALGGPGTYGAGGAIDAEQSSVLTGKGDSFTNNQAAGGSGVNGFAGGSGQGGAIFLNDSQASFKGSNFKVNLARGGQRHIGTAGDGDGGEVEALNSTLTITTSVFAFESVGEGAIATGTGGRHRQRRSPLQRSGLWTHNHGLHCRVQQRPGPVRLWRWNLPDRCRGRDCEQGEIHRQLRRHCGIYRVGSDLLVKPTRAHCYDILSRLSTAPATPRRLSGASMVRARQDNADDRPQNLRPNSPRTSGSINLNPLEHPLE